MLIAAIVIYVVGVPTSAYLIPRVTGKMPLGGFCLIWPIVGVLGPLFWGLLRLSEVGERHS